MNHPPQSDRTRANLSRRSFSEGRRRASPIFNRSLSRFIGSLSAEDAPHSQNRRNEPNLSPPTPPKMRNEPNLHRSQISNLRFPRSVVAYYAKRTQFTHTKCPAPHQKRETNPICERFRRNEPNFQPPIYILQYTIPWPNPTRPAVKREFLTVQGGFGKINNIVQRKIRFIVDP